MNQILSTEMSKNKKSKVIDIKKIIVFFAIVLIVIGIVLTANAGYTMYKKNKDKETIIAQQTQPEISFEQREEDILLTVEHDKPITEIIYIWNDGQPITINGNRRTSVSQTISLPDGTNNLTVKITDEIGSIATFQKQFEKIASEVKLSLSIIDDKIKIIATDSIEMDYIKYKWNSEQEIIISVEEDAEDKTIIQALVDIPEGLNTLSVVATNKNGDTKTKTQEIEGIASPKISVQRDGEYLIINIKDDNIITLINYTLNEQAYRINVTQHDADYYNAIPNLSVKANDDGKIIEVEYRQKMEDKGENVINITAENKKDAKSTFEGKCNNQ